MRASAASRASTTGSSSRSARSRPPSSRPSRAAGRAGTRRLDGFLEFRRWRSRHPGLDRGWSGAARGTCEIRKALKKLARCRERSRRPRAGCSSTRSVSRRWRATLICSTPGFAPNCWSPRRSCTTSDWSASWAAARPSGRPRRGVLLGHVHLGMRLGSRSGPSTLDPGGVGRASARNRLPPRPQRRADRRGGRAPPTPTFWMLSRRPNWLSSARDHAGMRRRAIPRESGTSSAGLTSRRSHVLTVLVVQQVFGLAAALTCRLFAGDGFPGWTAAGAGGSCGVCGARRIGATAAWRSGRWASSRRCRPCPP